MINIYDTSDNSLLGILDQKQLDFLIEEFEEEGTSDQDYYIDELTIEMLKSSGANEELLVFLRNCLKGREEVEIRWQKI